MSWAIYHDFLADDAMFDALDTLADDEPPTFRASGIGAGLLCTDERRHPDLAGKGGNAPEQHHLNAPFVVECSGSAPCAAPSERPAPQSLTEPCPPARESSPRATSPTSHSGPVARGHLLPTARGEGLARGSTATLADPASSWGQPARGFADCHPGEMAARRINGVRLCNACLYPGLESPRELVAPGA